jgi:Tfp pilus assembly protein PilV
MRPPRRSGEPPAAEHTPAPVSPAAERRAPRSAAARGVEREEGLSLMEVLVASVVSMMLLIMGYELLGAATSTAGAVSSRSVNSANARQAITDLEANLRFATGAWACGATPSTCGTTPQAPTTWQRASAATLYVTNAAGGSQQTCDEWSITASGELQETTGNGATVLFKMPGVMAWASSSSDQAAGFSIPLTGLVVIDLLVNAVNATAAATPLPATFATADAVSVHDFIAPDDYLATTTLPSAC